MIVAITGINSGLGRALVPKLQSEASIEKIIGIDLMEYEGRSEKIEFHKLDVRDREGIENALRKIDVLIHLAFIVLPKKLPKVKTIYDINVNGSKTVFQAAANNNVKKIIYTSSQSVYGHVKDCPKIVTEESSRLGIKTTNFYYSHTKALVEEYLDEFEKRYPGIKVVRFRPPIISGRNFLQNLDLINPKTKFRTLKSANHEGTMSFQLVHQEDLTNAILIALKGEFHGAYNVASNIIQNVEEFLLNKYNIKTSYIPRFLAKFAIRLGSIWTKLRWLQAILYNSLLNTDKIEQEMKWKPNYTTEDCIEEIRQEKA